MPSKYQTTVALAAFQSQEIAASTENYAAFLRTVAHNYKYTFSEQLLIHAQKPTATACAEIETWNRLGRWVNRGTKGIALLVDTDGPYKLRHVFDISDTNSRAGRNISLWKLEERDENEVAEALENSFGGIDSNHSFTDFLMGIAETVVDDNLPDYLSDLKRVKADSLLEELDDLNTEMWLKSTLRASVGYVLLERCGFNPLDEVGLEDFQHVRDFNTAETISILGAATSDISEMVLREISETVKSLRREERSGNRTIAVSGQSAYNDGRNQNTERSFDHGTDLYNAGRLSSSEPHRTGESEDWQVWNAAAQVPAEVQTGPVQRDDAVGQTEQPFGGDRPTGEQHAEPDHRGDEEEPGRDGEPESIRSDAVGADDEQHQEQRGGDGSDGADLQLSGRNGNYTWDVEFFHQDDEKNELIREHSPLKNHRTEIAAFFADHLDRRERGIFVRAFFVNGRVNCILSNGEQAGYQPYLDTFHMWRGEFDSRSREVYLSWDSVARHIEGMILLEQWLAPGEHLLPGVDEQIAFIDAEEEKNSGFVLPQAAIDYVLAGGSGISQGKLRIYEQFQLDESPKENIEFLKNEYGWGGHSDAIPGSGYWEEHDGKGIMISKTGYRADKENSYLIRWPAAEKRIRELIQADRYLSPAEKKEFPEYMRAKKLQAERAVIAEEFISIIRDYNDFQKQLGNEGAMLNQYVLIDCGSEFRMGKKTTWTRNENAYILPLMREAMQTIISENTHLTERCEAMLVQLNSDLAKPMEPTYDELNPPPPVPKEYRLALGDEVYIGSQQYEVLSLGDEEVVLYDPAFPLFNKTYPTAEFYDLLKESPLNDGYLHEIEAPAQENSPQKESLWESYQNIKAEHPNGLLIYDNGTILAMGADAETMAAALHLKTEQEDGVSILRLPEDHMSTYTYMLQLRGYDLTFAEASDTETVVRTMESKHKDHPTDAYPIARIDYLSTSGKVQESIDYFAEDAFLVDVQSENDAGVPMTIVLYRDHDGNTISRKFVENFGSLPQGLIEEDNPYLPPAEHKLVPPEAKPRPKQKVAMLLPEIPDGQRHNFVIEDDDLGIGTPSQRFENNVAAIRLLQKLEQEQRLATPDEQKVLSSYVGWGGLADCFDERHSRYHELKALLTEEEYAAARESTLTAFYTPPVVIRSMYKALENMNFRVGNILEPSCGVGNFLGMLPVSMGNSKIYGVELDSISGRIAQQLYQKSSIAVQGFETTQLPDSFFDCAIGNVPFGQFKVSDRQYDKHNFLIHDYFFARTLDKVRPGGIVTFITSKGTMDKENPNVRKYIAQRADLLGAIRLPNDTFKSAAGTEVTSDIIFLQKRDRMVDIEPDWVHLGVDANGLKMNQYFIENPDMVLGQMKEISGPFGPETACVPYEGQTLESLLDGAIQNIHAEIADYEFEDLSDDEDLSIPADPDVRNFSYALVDGQLYYRENSRMNPVDVSATAKSRIKGMIAIRDCVRQLIEYQTEDYPESFIKAEQDKLNTLYDEFSGKYGLINARANNSAFNADSSYFLLSSLEVLDDEGNFIRKADMFTKRTIKQKLVVTRVDTASEALALSLAEKAKIDIPYMEQLTGKTEQELFADLRGVIFLNPLHTHENDGQAKYLPADEYLSGNVREKLALAQRTAQLYPEDYAPNVEALTAVQPVDLTASEISVRLGATWLPPDIVEDFMFGLFETPRYSRWNIHVRYSSYTGEWNIEGKSYDRSNIKAHNTYGTSRINGYKIVEETLNLRDVRIFDYIEDANGKKTAVLNKKETAIAQGKQELIKQAFADWIWQDPARRETLCRLYNEKFNSIRPREYDGSHLNFVGINPEITLRPHQVNAIAHIMYGGNTLLAHVVGAGKTFEMVAAAMESKRLGLCHKSLFVVPNHLTEQWAAEFLQLYPSANILVATRKDFETKNRKRFCGRIATGDYDAIIIGHSQFEKIPMSIERQRILLEQQMAEIIDGISEAKRNRGDNFTVKQLEKTRKSIKSKLDKLNDQTRKDDVVTFEELGVDRIFIDEAHYYKNLAAFSKMRNVGGISQTEAQKSSDLYMKCRYLDEITGGRGVIFATGTPISNSMVEMYTMQKYLQYGTLRQNNLLHFDAWASTFGETVTAIELAPEGSGYRSKTRFARFYNLPELMAMFKETADIQTADMLKLPVPTAKYQHVILKPSEMQKEMVASLSDRAERVRNKMVDSSTDNMLLITNDGRKLALDQRLMNDGLPDSETSKVRACADNVYAIWQRTAEKRSTQMVFCDLSTPHGDGKFNVYDDLRDKLIAMGIPAEEIAYIHNAGTEAQKKEMFGKVRSGQIRVLIGSTQKMGAGTNVQQKLIALHHMDCPWRPSDLQQREGRIIRQGNENPEVEIYTYVTENTFDSYLYQLVESKQRFIGQIMTSKSPVRSAEDIDETALSYAEIKALCTGNPYIKEKMDLDIEVQRLRLLKANHMSQRYALEDKVIKEFPQMIASLEQRITGYTADMELAQKETVPDADGFSPMIVEGINHTEKKAAGAAILAACHAMTSPDPISLGKYRGLDMELSFDSFSREYKITLIGQLRHTTQLGTDIFGNILRLDNLISGFEERQVVCTEQLAHTRQQLESAKAEIQKPFPQEEALKTKSARLDELNILLNLDKRENEIVDGERSEDSEEPDGKSRRDRER